MAEAGHGTWGSLRHALALREASGEPAGPRPDGRSLSPLVSDAGAIIAKKSDALATSQPVYRGERFLLQVIAKQKHRVKGTVRDVSGSGQTLYIEPREVEAANTKLRQLAKKEEALTYKVRKELSARVGAPGTAEGLLRLQAAVTTIDLYATPRGPRTPD